MEDIPISKFKAQCAAVIDGVAKTRRKVTITRRGKAIAEIVPTSPTKKQKSWLGCMAGTAEIVGDIVGPTWPEWEKDLALKMARQRSRPARPARSDR